MVWILEVLLGVVVYETTVRCPWNSLKQLLFADKQRIASLLPFI